MEPVTINGIHITFIHKNDQWMIFVDNGVMPYFMEYENHKWRFVNIDTPEQLLKMEAQISNHIENT